MNYKHRNRRRGVLILIVLSTLVMFGLMAITFVLITGQARRTALITTRAEQYYEPPDRSTHEAALILLRGPSNPQSVVNVHSLLEDMYGDDTLAQVNVGGASPWRALGTGSVTLVCGGQLMNINAAYVETNGSPPPTYTFQSLGDDNPTLAANLVSPQKRVGCVLTMLNGPAVGRSLRIVGYIPAAYPATPTFQIVAPDDIAAATVQSFCTGNTPINYIINGPAFTGTGVGYNAGVGALASDPNIGQLSLRIDPKTSQIVASDQPGAPLASLLRPFLTTAEYTAAANASGGKIMANPDYTAGDYQHPFLPQFLNSGGTVYTIPSFHRPDLVSYWAAAPNGQMLLDSAAGGAGGPINWGSVSQAARQPVIDHPYGLDGIRGTADDPLPSNLDIEDAVATMEQRVLLRPNTALNPAFNGSNPTFDPTSTTGPWDVDTDGSGTPNAIWTDFGLPVRSMPDGRLVKPLVAAKIVDLDSRLNVNAHGTYAQTALQYYRNVDPTDSYYQSWAGTSGSADFRLWDSANRTPATPNLIRGLGYGPAEINLLPLFGPWQNANALERYRALLTARYTPLSSASNPNYWPGSGSAWDDPLHLNQWFDFGGNYWSFANAGGTVNWSDAGVYGAPPNHLGGGAIAMDAAGRPLYLGMGGTDSTNRNHERLNDPYKINLYKPTTWNTPFTPAELEALLRQNDYDAARLPNRLTNLLPTGHAAEVTTASWHVPAPAFYIPKHLLGASGQAGTVLGDLGTVPGLRALLPGRSIQDLLTAKFYVSMRATGSPASAGTLTSAQTLVQDAFVTPSKQLVPIELSLRLKMDLNRPFGNGQDTTTTFYQWKPDPNGGATQSNGTLGADPRNSLAGDDKWPMDARQLYARHLYVLTMLLTDLQTAYPKLTADQRARLVAQWAVNVVSFRDRSPVMPYFVYDPDPFTAAGWRPTLRATPTSAMTGVAPNPGVVWGVKRPQLLITETLALHARRTENTNIEYIASGGDPIDKRTQAAYISNDPIHPNPPKMPPDLDFDQQQMPLGSFFVEIYNPADPLDADTGDTYNPGTGAWSGGVSLNSAWRLIVVNPHDAANQTPNPRLDPDDPDPSKRPIIERSVYFMQPPAEFTADDPVAGQFYSTAATTLLHDHYAVIGPGSTEISRNTTNPTKCQQIVLDPTATDPVQFKYSQAPDGSNELIGAGSAIKTPAAVVVDQPRRLSASEPVGGYPTSNPDGTPMAGSAYSPPYNHPFDVYVYNGTQVTDQLRPDKAPLADGLVLNYKVVYLQRLANPGLPYDAQTNPYRTIDSMPVDLYAYNGWEDPQSVDKDPNVVQANQLWSGAVVRKDVPRSHQRGDGTYGLAAQVSSLQSNLWVAEPPAQTTLPAYVPNPIPKCIPNGDQRPDLALQHTLGLLGKPFFPTAATPWDGKDAAGKLYVEYIGGIPPSATTPPMPWLTWNGRPFASEIELLLVPYARSSMLLTSLWRPDKLEDPTLFPTAPVPTLPTGVFPPHGIGVNGGLNGTGSPPTGFPYLLEFLNPGATTPAGPEFYRLLDLVGVPSPFVGAEIQGDPATFAVVDPDPTKRHVFYPPFNRIPTYREPGRINLNTLTSNNVWTGLWNGDSGAASDNLSYADFNTGRGTSPFIPFRSCGSAIWTGTAATELGASLFRPATAGGSSPLFVKPHTTPGTDDCQNTDRNPLFRYHAIQRMENLTTTRSNVFAVWITVGYFLATPLASGPDAGHPDGYMLGAEVGADTGDIKRHRAFYIIDRSIPVGFQRGQDLNVERTILLKRYIE